jgi:hypothetical protein
MRVLVPKLSSFFLFSTLMKVFDVDEGEGCETIVYQILAARLHGATFPHSELNITGTSTYMRELVPKLSPFSLFSTLGKVFDVDEGEGCETIVFQILAARLHGNTGPHSKLNITGTRI